MAVRVTVEQETRITVTAATGIITHGVFQWARIQPRALARDEFKKAEFMEVDLCLVMK